MEKENMFMVPDDFFERDKVIQLRSLQGGETFLVILLILNVKFNKNGGMVSAGNTEVSAEQTLQMIARETGSRLIDARRALALFLDMGFMEERNGFLYLVGIDTEE